MWTTKQKDAFLKKKVRDVFALARDEILQLTAGAYAARVRAAVLEGAWKYMAHRSVEIVEDWVPCFDEESEDFRRGMRVALRGFAKEIRRMGQETNRTLHRPTKGDQEYIRLLMGEDEED